MIVPAFKNGLAREWQRIMQQPSYWASLFLLPALVMVLMAGIIAQPNVTEVPIDIVDNSQSKASADLIFRLDASRALSVQKITPQVDTALQRSQQKLTFGYLIIPQDFQQRLTGGRQSELQLFVNQQNFMLGNVLTSQVLRQVIESSIRESTKTLMVAGDSKQQALELTMPLANARSVQGNAYLNYRTFLTATMLPHLWHVLVMVVTVIALGKEFKQGTGQQWLACCENNLIVALTSKMLLPVLVMAIWISLYHLWVLWDNHLLAKVNIGSLLLASWLTQACYHAAGLLVVAITANYRFALSLAAFYTTPAFAFVGVTFPTFSMNSMAKQWLALLPIGQYMHMQNAILHWQQSLATLTTPLQILMLFFIAFIFPALLLLNQKVSQAQYWYRH